MRTLEQLIKTNKRTGEIKTCGYPRYKGINLSDVYGTYSYAKAQGLQYCLDLLHSFNPDDILSYGITSANTFQFTFAAVFKKDGACYVLWCTKAKDEVYLLK